MKINKRFAIVGFVLFILMSCSDTAPIPKPSTFLKTEFPEHTYRQYISPGAYQFDLADLYQSKSFELAKKNYSVQEIDLGPLNGTLFLYYLKIPSKDSLPEIINFANDKVDEHKIMADKISFKRVWGSLFLPKGRRRKLLLLKNKLKFMKAKEPKIWLNYKPNWKQIWPN